MTPRLLRKLCSSLSATDYKSPCCYTRRINHKVTPCPHTSILVRPATISDSRTARASDPEKLFAVILEKLQKPIHSSRNAEAIYRGLVSGSRGKHLVFTDTLKGYTPAVIPLRRTKTTPQGRRSLREKTSQHSFELRSSGWSSDDASGSLDVHG